MAKKASWKRKKKLEQPTEWRKGNNWSGSTSCLPAIFESNLSCHFKRRWIPFVVRVFHDQLWRKTRGILIPVMITSVQFFGPWIFFFWAIHQHRWSRREEGGYVYYKRVDEWLALNVTSWPVVGSFFRPRSSFSGEKWSNWGVPMAQGAHSSLAFFISRTFFTYRNPSSQVTSTSSPGPFPELPTRFLVVKKPKDHRNVP